MNIGEYMQKAVKNYFTITLMLVALTIGIMNFGTHLFFWLYLAGLCALWWFMATKSTNKWAKRLVNLF